MNSHPFFQNRKWPAWTAEILALIGLVIYASQAVMFAHTTMSSMDEGAYLYKGLLFAKGIYRPFQPYGVLTNKAPLAFLIPGYVQLIFGAGLRTGRYLAILVGMLAVVGMWVAARRMGNKWLAAGAVWVVALSPAVIKIYSVGVSQGLIACMMAWMLVFSLGEKRPLWQLLVSSMLASLMILTRQNMAPVLPILLLYIFWQNGWKAGAWASLAGVGVFVIGHVIYWPGILQLWTPWLPFLPASLNEFKVLPTGGSVSPLFLSIPPIGRLFSALQGFRWHFIILTGSFFSLLLWPKMGQWKKSESFRAAVFLAVLFFSLLALHAYASLGKDYCVFCFAPYVSFFSVAGLLLVVLLIQSWNRNPSFGLQIALVILVLLFTAGTGYATFEDTGKSLLNLSIPHLRAGQILPGFTSLRDILFNKFALDQASSRRIAALGAGLLIGLGVIALTLLIKGLWFKQKYQFGFLLVNVFLMSGLVFSFFWAGAQGRTDCKSDVIAANEAAGASLARVIPPDSKVYWRTDLSVAPLLYAPQARIYPALINGSFAVVAGGDPDSVAKFGLWNAQLSRQWRDEADVILIEEARYAGWASYLSPGRFQEFQSIPIDASCVTPNRLRIFERIP